MLENGVGEIISEKPWEMGGHLPMEDPSSIVAVIGQV